MSLATTRHLSVFEGYAGGPMPYYREKLGLKGYDQLSRSTLRAVDGSFALRTLFPVAARD